MSLTKQEILIAAKRAENYPIHCGYRWFSDEPIVTYSKCLERLQNKKDLDKG